MADWIGVPLGIDLGSTRVRIALAEKNRDGDVRIAAVVSRDLPERSAIAGDVSLLAAIVEDALTELRTRERRCVFALDILQGTLRHVKLPKMSWTERLRAARFEVNRWPGFDGERPDITVRVHPIPHQPGTYAIGAASTAIVAERATLARACGLRPVGIDHASCALRRLLPGADAIVDVGADRAAVHAFGAAGPLYATIDIGGAAITRGIARELALSLDTAEKRKRILGCAGAGMNEQDALIAGIAAAVERVRSRVRVDRIAVVGNGARLPGFIAGLESATGAQVEMPVPAILDTSPYPADVTRTAAPDWALAAALASWSTAA